MQLAVAAHVRHAETGYDALLARAAFERSGSARSCPAGCRSRAEEVARQVGFVQFAGQTNNWSAPLTVASLRQAFHVPDAPIGFVAIEGTEPETQFPEDSACIGFRTIRPPAPRRRSERSAEQCQSLTGGVGGVDGTRTRGLQRDRQGPTTAQRSRPRKIGVGRLAVWPLTADHGRLFQNFLQVLASGARTAAIGSDAGAPDAAAADELYAASASLNSTFSNVTTGLSLRPSPFSSRTSP